MKIVENYLIEIKEIIEQIPVAQIEDVIALLHEARAHRKQVFIMGNGGSASTATHFVCDLAKNTGAGRLPAFRVIGLTDNMAVVTAYANDDGYETIFARQLHNLLQPEDIVIAISGSGNSKNILCAVELANQMGAVTIGLTGLTGGTLKTLAQKNIHVPGTYIDQVEDIHLMLEHMICRSLKQMEVPELEEAAIASPVQDARDNDALVQELFGKSLPLIRGAGTSGLGKTAGSEVLTRITSELASPLDLHDLLSRVLYITVEHVNAVGGSIVLLDENGEVMEGALIYGGKVQQPHSGRLTETVHHGLAGWVLENRQPALVENTKEDPRWMPRGWEATLDLSRSAVSVPIIARDRVYGVLTLTRMQINRFTMEELSLLTSITLALSYSLSSRTTIITGR